MEQAEIDKIRAWKVTVVPWGDTADAVGILFARSRDKARFSVWSSAHEVGYTGLRFSDFHVVRAPEFDCLKNSAGIGHRPIELARRLLNSGRQCGVTTPAG